MIQCSMSAENFMSYLKKYRQVCDFTIYKSYCLLKLLWGNLATPISTKYLQCSCQTEHSENKNASESYNNRLITRVRRRLCPNSWVFVKNLQNEENLARRSYRRFQSSNQAGFPEQKIWRKSNAMICNVKQIRSPIVCY